MAECASTSSMKSPGAASLPTAARMSVTSFCASVVTMSEWIFWLYIFAFAALVGYLVISGVPPLLHTPLMSTTNAISGISLVGSLVTAGADYNLTSSLLGLVAV